MKSDNLLDLSDPDLPVYRIFPLHRLLSLLRSGKNALVSPAKWDDPFENFFLRAAVEGPDGEKISISSLADDWYGQCWTLNADTDAMWRIYSHAKDGVKVRTTIRKLFDSFYNATDGYADLKFLVGKVRYWSEAEISDLMSKITFHDIAFGGQATGFARLLCVKREAFAHENEVRLLFQDLHPKHGAGGVALFDFDANAICDEIVIDPRLEKAEAASFAAQIAAAGCALPVSQSPLYRSPEFTMRLS